jgi:hypothetical protein
MIQAMCPCSARQQAIHTPNARNIVYKMKQLRNGRIYDEYMTKSKRNDIHLFSSHGHLLI